MAKGTVAPPHRTVHLDYPVAVVGLGRQGQSILAALAGMGYAVVGGCDIDVSRLAPLRTAHPNLFLTESLDALVARAPGVVVVATLADVRADVIEQLARGGVRRILSEKPIATTVADARRVMTIARAHGVRVVMHTPRSHVPEYRQVGELVRRGTLGALQRIDLRFKSSGFGNIGSHFLPLAFELAGRAPVSASRAWFDQRRAISRTAVFADRNGYAEFALGDGVVVSADNREGPFKGPATVTVTCAGGQVVCRESGVPTWTVFDASTNATEERRFAGGAITARGEAAVRLSLDRCIETLIEGESGHDLEWAVAAVEAIVAAQLAFTTDQPVSLPLPVDVATPFAFT